MPCVQACSNHALCPPPPYLDGCLTCCPHGPRVQDMEAAVIPTVDARHHQIKLLQAFGGTLHGGGGGGGGRGRGAGRRMKLDMEEPS